MLLEIIITIVQTRNHRGAIVKYTLKEIKSFGIYLTCSSLLHFLSQQLRNNLNAYQLISKYRKMNIYTVESYIYYLNIKHDNQRPFTHSLQIIFYLYFYKYLYLSFWYREFRFGLPMFLNTVNFNSVATNQQIWWIC